MPDQAFIQSLNTAAALIQNSISSRERVLQVISEQIVRLGLRGGIALLNRERGELAFISVANPKGLIQDVIGAVSKLTGLSVGNFTFPYEKVDVYRTVIEEKRPVFVATTGPVIEQLLPPKARPFLGRLLNAFSRTPGIYCPLVCSGTVTGTLNMAGQALSEENVPEITAFANHVSVALDNAKLLDEIRRSEEIFRGFIEQSTDGFVLVNNKGTIIEWNKAVEIITGIERREAIGKPFWDIQYSLTPKERRTPERYERTKSILEKWLSSGWSDAFSREIEVVISRADGASATILQSAFPVKTAEGFLLGSVIRDITEKKKIEGIIRNNEKLETVGILAGGIAHDFNNLLTGIFGYMDLARLDNEAGMQRMVAEHLSNAFTVFDLAKNLALQLLTFSKGGKPAKKNMRLQTLLTEATTFALSGSPITARFSISDDLWSCMIDDSQFRQVINNIVINARQAMPAGGSIRVSGENVLNGASGPIPLPEGKYVKISIQDSGAGIPQEHLSRIFDPFFTTKPGGSGLGLATSHSIIRNHDGLIQAASEPGNGSTFTIFIPAANSRDVKELQPVTATANKHPGSGRALVVDDNGYIRDFCGQVLQKMGYSVEYAADGTEAIEQYRKCADASRPFAFVILDLTIPGGMGGMETLSELLKIDPEVIAIASSGYSEDPIMTDPSAFGFAAMLKKPYQKADLEEVLARLPGKIACSSPSPIPSEK